MSQSIPVATDPFQNLFLGMDFEQITNYIAVNITATDSNSNSIIASCPTALNNYDIIDSSYFDDPSETSMLSEANHEPIDNFSFAVAPALLSPPLEATKATEYPENKTPKRPGRYKNASPAVKKVSARLWNA
ncbi:hypothetical protein VHEMI02471 [[Torrubiella] hemipterigena]|uniref:Uncharacterized protein n=1 Tax=[Torrubiella] hemipterigena TaxID=1531966 RepID=A0A0A1T899_9HYPO|nr:hypothetical protein VHEMI02471 [[Torrubiella] hemipterigena]